MRGFGSMTSMWGLRHKAQECTPSYCSKCVGHTAWQPCSMASTLGAGHCLQRYRLHISSSLCCILPSQQGGGAAKLLSIYAPAVSDTVHELWHSLNSLSTDFLVIIVIMFVWCFSDLLNVMVNKKTACRFLINFSSQ